MLFCCPRQLPAFPLSGGSKAPWMAAGRKFWHLHQIDTKSWLVCSWRWGVSRAGWDLIIFYLFISWFSWLFLCVCKHFLPVFPCLCCFPWWIDVAVIEWWWVFFFYPFLFSSMKWGELMWGGKKCQRQEVFPLAWRGRSLPIFLKSAAAEWTVLVPKTDGHRPKHIRLCAWRTWSQLKTGV